MLVFGIICFFLLILTSIALGKNTYLISDTKDIIELTIVITSIVSSAIYIILSLVK